MLKLLRTSKFFPAVSEIFSAATEMTDFVNGSTLPSADEAWEEVMLQVRKNHVYHPWFFPAPEIELAVTRFGKTELCSLEMNQVNTARAQFIRFYDSICMKKKEQRLNYNVLNALPDHITAQFTENPPKEKLHVIAGGLSNCSAQRDDGWYVTNPYNKLFQ